MPGYFRYAPVPANRSKAVPTPARAPKPGPPPRPALWHVLQLRAARSKAAPPARNPRQDGLPAQLRDNGEALSGQDLSDVRVHRDSAEPSRLGALAFTRGAEIHLGPGQDRHLPHELWHVVQQKQGRVAATTQLMGEEVNDSPALEREADMMGDRLLSGPAQDAATGARTQEIVGKGATSRIVQCYQSIFVMGQQAKRSQHARYITFGTSEMLVQPGAAAVERSYYTNRNAQNGYQIWKPTMAVIGDCVAAAEELMHGQKLKYGAPDVSVYRDTGEIFGDTDDANRARGKATDLGHSANPSPLTAYLITRQGYKTDEDRPQFHGAAIVAQDGTDNVTLEATAPTSGDISRDRVEPVYDMYGAGRLERQTFKTAYQAEYGKDATVSVIEPAKKLPDTAADDPLATTVTDWVMT